MYAASAAAADSNCMARVKIVGSPLNGSCTGFLLPSARRVRKKFWSTTWVEPSELRPLVFRQADGEPVAFAVVSVDGGGVLLPAHYRHVGRGDQVGPRSPSGSAPELSLGTGDADTTVGVTAGCGVRSVVRTPEPKAAPAAITTVATAAPTVSR